jgi:hypothetical protein
MIAIELLEPTGPSEFADLPDVPPPDRFIRNSDLVSRSVAGETVVVPICRGVGDLDAIFAFNSVGSHLWGLLAETRTAAELSNFVVRRFAISEEQAESDVHTFLSDLQEAGLVRTL